MAAKGKCDKCGKILSGPDSYHNKIVKCSSCGEMVRLLAASGGKKGDEISGSSLAYGGIMALTAFLLLLQFIFIIFYTRNAWAQITSLSGIARMLSFTLLAGSVIALYMDSGRIVRVFAIAQSFYFSLISIGFIYYFDDIIRVLWQAEGAFSGIMAVIAVLVIILYPVCAIFSIVKAVNPPNKAPEWLKRIRRRRHDKLSVKDGQGDAQRAEGKNSGGEG